MNFLNASLAAVEKLGRFARARRRLLRVRDARPKLALSHIDHLELLEWVRNDARPPVEVIYDLGANVGTWTTLAETVFPKAQVHAFEPLPIHADQFARLRPRATLHRVALGPTAGEAEIDITSFSDSASLLRVTPLSRDIYGVTAGQTMRVPVVRLDDWRTTHALPCPDLVKLDLQGYELEALRGALDTLAQARYVVTELSFQEFYSGQPLFHDMVAFLAKHGFYLTAFSDSTVPGFRLLQADALFCRGGGLPTLTP